MTAEDYDDHSPPDSPTAIAEDSKLQDAKIARLLRLLGPLETDKEKAFVDRECCLRYLRARHWSAHKAAKMLRETLEWRTVMKPDEILWDEIAQEAETGKMYKTDYLDKEGHPVILMVPGRQNTNDHDGQIKFLVYTLERTIHSLPPGVSKMTWVVDYTGWTYSKSPPLKTARETLNILQNHYPERLHKAVAYQPPTIFSMFWKMVSPFVDPITHKKVVFVPKKDGFEVMSELFDMDQVETELGGKAVKPYNHAEYGTMMRKSEKLGKDNKAFSAVSAAVAVEAS
eukprot:jgi/Mesvir1/5250/Mv15369-RA.1